MPLTFAEAEKWYREDKINDLTRNEAGIVAQGTWSTIVSQT